MKSDQEPGMLDNIKRYSGVVDGTFEYEDDAEVIRSIKDKILAPSRQKLKSLHN